MTSSKDTAAAGADAAGGEAIYSSDGLPPLPAPVPPIKSRQDVPASAEADDDDGDAILDSESMSPTDAFEVFGGRAYLRPAGGSRRSGGSAAAATAARNLVAGSAAGGGTGLAVEPPLVRLARLSAELTELERDLATSSSTSAAAGAGTGSLAGVSNEELTKLARELSSRLEVMSNQHGIAPGAGGTGKTLSDNLTRLVREELTKMEQTSTSASSDDTAAASDSNGSGGGGGIVYELYASSSTGHVGPTSAASAASEASIEERLGRIERAVGSTAGSTSTSQSSLAAAAASVSGSGASSGRTVLERLEEAEKMAGRVDAKALDAAAARAKVIR